jgi:hypothetical protein
MTTSGRQASAKLTRERLIKQFAGYLRASFVYPATNPRVIRPGEVVVAGFNQHRDAAGMMRLCLHRDRFRVNQHRIELAEGDLTWMREVFMKTAIAGVDLGPNLSAELLSEFASRLQTNFQARDTTDFRLKWLGPFAGVQPLELHVDGEHTFAKEIDDDDTLRPSPGIGGASNTAKRLGLDQESPEVGLLVALESNTELLERLDRLRQRINLEMLNERSLTGLDVLAQLVKTLPAEAFHDPDYVSECVDKILCVAEMRMVSMVTDSGEDMEADLFNVMVSVGRKIFASSEAGGGRSGPDSPSGRPEDEVFTDDLKSLLTEYEALPLADGLSIESQVDLKNEMLGILLHQMVRAEEDETANALAPELSRLVREAGNAETLLGAYVDRCMAHRGKATEKKNFWRVAEFVQGHGFASLLGHDDLLRTDTVAFAFPYLFNHFLDSLEWGNDDDLSKIGDVCYGVGSERIRAAKDVLLGESGVLVPARTRKILAKPNRDVLPLAEIILEDGSQWITPLAAQFLKQLKMPGTASLALRAVHPVSMLPRSYLIGLCRSAFEGGFGQDLIDQSASLVCRFIRNTADDSEQRERRLYAIQSLRGVHSQEVLRLLMELKTVCGPLSLNKELRAVRKAAIEVLDYHTGGGKG